MSWHPDLQLDALMGQRAGSEHQLQAQGEQIAPEPAISPGSPSMMSSTRSGRKMAESCLATTMAYFCTT